MLICRKKSIGCASIPQGGRHLPQRHLHIVCIIPIFTLYLHHSYKSLFIFLTVNITLPPYRHKACPILKKGISSFLFSPKPLIPSSQHASTQQRFCLRPPQPLLERDLYTCLRPSQPRRLVPMQSGRRGLPTCLRPPQPLQKEGLSHLLKGVLTLCLKG